MFGSLIGRCAILGLAVGSFLNVVIYRVPRGESVVTPRSSCPACGAPIRERDNIPVVSWLVLRGRCRDCRAPISMRYPLVEWPAVRSSLATAARFGYRVGSPGLSRLVRRTPGALVHRRRADDPAKEDRLPDDGPRRGAVARSRGGDREVARLSDRDRLRRRLVHGLLCAVSGQSTVCLALGTCGCPWCSALSLGWLGVGYVLLGFFAANLVGAVVGVVAHRVTSGWNAGAGFPTGYFWLWVARSRCSRVPTSCAHSATHVLESYPRERSPDSYRTSSIRIPCSSHSGSLGMRTCGLGKDPSRRPEEGRRVEQGATGRLLEPRRR